jgi:PAS domain S-box-containing protein
VTAKRQIPPPKRLSAPARPSSNNSALLPLALGCSFPLVATILDILGQGLPLFSLESIIAVQQTQPLHWLLDLVPVAMMYLPLRKNSSVVATPLASQPAGMRGSTASPAGTPPAQSQKAITTLQDELTAVKNQLAQVHAREATLNNLIDNAKDAILTLSVDGTITSVNRGAEEMFGWTRQEMIGHPLNNMLALPSVPRLEEHLAHLLSDPSAPTMIDLEFVHSDGTGLWVEGGSSVIRDAANQPANLFVIYRDLRHRQQQSAGRDTAPHAAMLQQQDSSQPQLDHQPQVASSSAYEVTQSGALKVPGFLTGLAPAADSLSESEAAPSEAAPSEAAPSEAAPGNATPAFAPPLEAIDLQEQETSSGPVQFAFVADESGSDTQVTPSVSAWLALDEETTNESQEVSSAPVQFTLINEAESKSPDSFPVAPPLSPADEPPLEMLQPSTTSFNFSEALSNIGGDENLLAELAGIFLEEYPEILANVRKAVASNDSEALVYHAHALKGSVGNFVAADAQNAARKLEQMGREGDLTDATTALSELDTALALLTPALNDIAVQTAA